MNLTTHMKTWYGMISTFGTVGRFSNMPGTLASIIACIIWILLGGVPIWGIAALILIGTIASDRYVKATKSEDPGEVVIDEVVGCWIACFGFDLTYVIIALFLFRIIDITKPFPIKQMEKLPGGLGVMADDILGGALTNLLIRFFQWLFFAGGITAISEVVGI